MDELLFAVAALVRVVQVAVLAWRKAMDLHGPGLTSVHDGRSNMRES